MGVASPYGAFWGLVTRSMFSGVPLGVLCAALGDVGGLGAFWVAGLRLRGSVARSGRSLGSIGLELGVRCRSGFWACRSGLGCGSIIGNRKTERGRGVRFWAGRSGGAPLGAGIIRRKYHRGRIGRRRSSRRYRCNRRARRQGSRYNCQTAPLVRLHRFC